jgi:hypothetical protein
VRASAINGAVIFISQIPKQSVFEPEVARVHAAERPTRLGIAEYVSESPGRRIT